MKTPVSDEVRFHSIKSAFEDEPEISESTADAIALGLEALLVAVTVVILVFVVGALW